MSVTQPDGVDSAPPRPARSKPLRNCLLALVVLLGLATAAVRLIPLTDSGRRLVESALTGAKVGRFGRLEVRGLKGDLWTSFTVTRLAIADRRGVWLQAHDVSMRWRWPELLERRVHVEALAAGEVVVLRAPALGPPEANGPTPVSLLVDDVRLRLITAPAFSLARGDFDLTGDLALDRRGPGRGRLQLASRTHAGDFLTARFNVRKASAFFVEVRGREASGGAIAGMAGLAPDQPFTLLLQAGGTPAGGRFQLLARSGGSIPAAAAGAWTTSGGAGRARIELADSRLLAPYQAMVGPVASFNLSCRRMSGELYALAFDLAGDNLRLAAQGSVEANRITTGPTGLALDLAIANASRIFPQASIGPTFAHLGLGGGVDHWVVVGRASANRLSLGGYSLARVDGPIRLEGENGEVAFNLAAVGAGGAGRNVAAALLGARPRASAQGTQFADGRLLVRALSVVGPGLNVNASGERGLFGGLGLKGQARIGNLDFAHAGAKGAISATWQASQSRSDSPWTFAFDARGDRFAAGFAEADRLLGASPRLTARGEAQGGGLALAQVRLEGAALTLDANGRVGWRGDVGLKLDWNAHGPFDVGPLEIAGAAAGTGEVTGTLGAPRADLTADLASIAAPGLTLTKAHVTAGFGGAGSENGGRITLAADSSYGPAKAASDFHLAAGGVDLSGLALDAGGLSASGALGLRARAPSSADLSFAVRPGAFVTAGHASGKALIEDRAGALSANLTLAGNDLVLRDSGESVRTIKVSAAGPLDDLPYQLSAEGGDAWRPWRVGGSGRFARRPGGSILSLAAQGRIGRTNLSTLAPAEIAFNHDGIDGKARLSVGGDGAADIAIRETGGELAAKATLGHVNLALLDADFTGRLDADLSLAGRGPTLTGRLSGRLADFGERDEPGAAPMHGAIKIGLASGAVTLDASLADARGLTATSQLTLPAEASAAPFRIALDRHRPIAGRFAMTGEIGPLWTLLMGADRSLTGQANVSATLAGTLADPRAVGAARLENGAFDDAQTGLRMSHIALAAQLADNAVDVTAFSAADGASGQMTGSGRVSLARDGVSSFRLQLRNFRLIDNETAKAEASGEATINRAADGRVRLAGALTIDHALISPNPPVPNGVVPMDVVEVGRASDRSSPVGGASVGAPSPVALDVAFRAQRGLFVKGRGLNVELSLDAHVNGTTADPVLSGTARIVRGDYDFAGKRFEFDDRGLVRLGSTADTIRLDLTATREDPSLTAVIKISGTAAKPKITLTSSPALPTDEVLSQVLFGASAARLSGLEAAQLASALSGLAGGGGFDVIGGLGKLAHLDTLAFGQTATAGPTISGGKYLKDNVYIELTGGNRDGSAAQVEWRARKHLSIISRLGGQGDSQLSVSWRRDF